MKKCCYLRIEDVSVGDDAFDYPDYMYICKFCKRCEHYKVKMVEKIYSVGTEVNGYADNTFTGTIEEYVL